MDELQYIKQGRRRGPQTLHLLTSTYSYLVESYLSLIETGNKQTNEYSVKEKTPYFTYDR